MHQNDHINISLPGLLLWLSFGSLMTTMNPELTLPRTVGGKESREKKFKFKRSVAPSLQPQPESTNESTDSTSDDPNIQYEPRQSRSVTSNSSIISKEDIPLPETCQLEEMKQIFTDKEDLGSHFYLLDRFSLYQARLNTLKLVNSYQQEQRTINGHSYTTSTSPLLGVYCIYKNEEGSLFNTYQQETFLEDFRNLTGFSLVMDYFFLGKSSCLLSHPVPLLLKSPTSCLATLTDHAKNLTLDEFPDMDHLTQDLNEHSMAPLYLSNSQYPTTTPERLVCPSRVTNFDHKSNIFRRQYSKLKMRMTTVDAMIGSNLEQGFLDLLEDCGLKEEEVLQHSVPVQTIKKCGEKLLESRQKREKREIRLLNIENSPLFKVGTSTSTINKDFNILRNNQDVLEKELAKIRTGQKVLYGVNYSLEKIIDREENLVHGAAVLASVTRRLHSQIEAFKSASSQIRLDNDITMEKLDNFIKHVETKVTRDVLCKEGACVVKNSTVFYSHENGLLAVTSEAKISSKNILVIKCQINDDIKVPTFNLARIDRVLPKSVRVVKNHNTNTYTRDCMKDPQSCNLMVSLDTSALAHGVYLSIRDNDTLAQCPDKLVITDQDPKARTKTCHLDPIIVLPPLHLPATGKSIGQDMLTSISLLDIPDKIALTRLNLLYHSQKLDLTVEPALSWLWTHEGQLRKIVRVPTGHFLTTVTCLAGGFIVMTLVCVCYLCKCCGCTKLSPCLSCRSRTVTVERTLHDPQQNPRDPPSRSFTKILATSCNCCRYPGRSDSLDVVNIANRPRSEASEHVPSHESGPPAAQLHSNLMQALSRSAQMLDKHLENPPAYNPSPGPHTRTDQELPGPPAEVTSFSTTQF